MSKQVGCTPTSFPLLSICSSSASVAWQSLLLMLTSIDGQLHSPLISLINVILSPFCLLHTTSIIIFMTYITIVILPLHDHVVDIVFVAKPPCIIFHTCHSWFIALSRYTAGGIHIESYLVLVSSCNPHVVINRSVMIIIIRALPKKRERPKRKKRPKKGQCYYLFFHTCASK